MAAQPTNVNRIVSATRTKSKRRGLGYPYLENEMRLGTPIPLDRMCRLAHVSRAGYYRWQNALPAVGADLDLRDEIQWIALELPSYGWSRITAELQRRG